MSLPAATDVWSDDLKAQTRDVIKGRGMFTMLDGQLHLKHATSRFGTVAPDDLWRGVLKVVDRQTGAEATFTTADELIAAGCVID